MMRISVLKIIVFTALLLPVLNLQAQDFVITKSGDTLKCVISKPAFMSIFNRYITPDMAKPLPIKPEDFKEFHIAKKDYTERLVYRPGDNTPMFLHLLEKGKIDLYEEVDQYMGSPTSTASYSIKAWFLAKGTDKLIGLKVSSFLGAPGFKTKKSRENDFAEIIMDNKVVYDKYMADDKFSFKEIRNLIHLYNTGESYSKP